MKIADTDPKEIEDWIDHLSQKEEQMFNQGYLIAVHGFVEELVDAKRKICNKMVEMLGEEDDMDTEHYAQLQGRVRVLDLFENHYRKRLRVLEPSAPS